MKTEAGKGRQLEERRMGRAVVFSMLIAVLGAGCVSMDSTDATRDPDFYITESDTIEKPFEPMGFIRVEKVGWYLFALFPIVSVTMDELVWELMVPEAKKRGANGVINLQYELLPPSFWRFESVGAVPLPDWSSKGVVTGMAVKIEDPGKKADRPVEEGG
ncbi:MAG: hypothetical protein ACYTFG_01130 [Planctomycetota bacterium]|jgi:hypothetical protein